MQEILVSVFQVFWSCFLPLLALFLIIISAYWDAGGR